MVVGYIMSHRTSNLERIAWAVSLLNVQPTDCVLEIGYGPGVAINMLGKLATEGFVYGVDRSQLMFDQASRRNRDLIKAGRVELMVASASRLPTLGRAVDKVLDINSFQFWNDQVDCAQGSTNTAAARWNHCHRAPAKKPGRHGGRHHQSWRADI